MPRLPSIDDLGTRPVPQSRRGIATNPQAGAVGEALQGVGETAYKAGQKMYEQQDKLQYASAKADFLSKQITIQQELQNEPNHERWSQIYAQRTKSAREESAKLIGNRSDRALFDTDTGLDIARGAAEVNKSVFARRVSTETENVKSTLFTLSDQAQDALDPAAREQVIRTANDLIGGLQSKGYISAVEAGDWRRTWTQSYKVKQIDTRLARGDHDGALALFAASVGQLDDATEIRLGQQIRDARDNHEVLSVARGAVDGSLAPGAPAGLVTAGNIDVHKRPVVRNRDGTISTVRTISIGTEEGEVVIPTVIGDRVVSNAEAEAEYRRTGKHLGIFKDVDSAKAFAESLHEQQAQEYGGAYQMPVAGTVTNTYAQHQARGSHGLDIGAPRGSAVRPIGSGVVTSVSENGRSGRFVIVKHADGHTSSYSHLGDQSVEVGDQVGPGTVLGTVGMTGNTTGPHVHLRVKDAAGRDVDPQSLVGRKGAAVPDTTGRPSADLPSIYSTIDAVAAQRGWSIELTEKAKTAAAGMVQREKAAYEQHQGNLYDTVLEKVAALGNGFTDVSQLGSGFYQLDPDKQISLRKSADANLKAQADGGVKANGDVARALHVMAIEAPDKLAAANLAQYRPFMTAGEFDEIGQAQARARTQGQWNPRGGIQNALTWGEKFGGVKLDDSDDRYRVYRFMEDRARTWSAQNGGKAPTENEYQAFFREATQQVRFTGRMFGVDWLAPDSTGRAYEAVSAPYRAMIVRQFRAVNGRDPNEGEIANWFERLGKPLQ